MCCLFGMIDCGGSFTGRQRAELLSVLAAECEERGADAAGIAYNAGGKLHIVKRPVPAHKLSIRLPNEAGVIMGHTRMTTQGSAKKNYNNHPFPGNTPNGAFALAHNGVLRNDRALRKQLHLPYTKIETDSYVAVQLIEQKKALDFASLKYMAEQVEGSFTFTVLDQQNNLYIVKGDNPLCLYCFPQKRLFLYASTESILIRALSDVWDLLGTCRSVELDCGDIVKISAKGKISRSTFYFQEFPYRWSWMPGFAYRYGSEAMLYNGEL